MALGFFGLIKPNGGGRNSAALTGMRQTRPEKTFASHAARLCGIALGENSYITYDSQAKRRSDWDGFPALVQIVSFKEAPIPPERTATVPMKHRIKSCLPLLLLYAASALIRFLLALATSTFPTIGIDEFLYVDLGRSIATEGSLLFRGQPADYSFILYPLVISPIYLLFREGANYYRLIQLWNILLMSASVFPVYGLCRRMLRNEKKALFAAALGMLLPDFMLGQLVFSEAILYPLFFTVVYCVYRYIDEKKPGFLLAVGALGGLMYCAKPGSVVPALLFLPVACGGAVARKESKNALYAVAGVLAAGAVAGFFWCLARFAFGYEGGLLSLYASQTGAAEGWHLDAFGKAVLTYPYYFILSCGIIGFVYPFLTRKYWNDSQKKLWAFSLASLLALMIGTAWVVNRTEYNANLLHLRYIAMYIPLMLFFCCIPREEDRKGKPGKTRPQKESTPGIIARYGVPLAFVCASTIIWGCKIGAQTSAKYPLAALSLLINPSLPLSSEMIGNVVIIALCIAVFFVLFRFYGKKTLQTISIAAMAFWMLINGICGYALIAQDMSAVLAADGREALSRTEGRGYLYIKSMDALADGGIDVNTRSNSDVVLLNDFINHLYHDGQGSYVPFLPEPSRGFTPKEMTADVDTLVLDNTSYPLLQLSPYATAEKTSNQNFCVVRFTPGKRLVDSTIGQVVNQTLTANKPGILLLYDPALLERPLTIRLDIESGVDQTLKMNHTKKLETVELKQGRSWYEVTFAKPEDAFNFITEEADIQLYGYALISQGE